MTETQQILGRLSALRKRLGENRETASEPPSVTELARQAAASATDDGRMDAAVRPLTVAPGEDGPPLPRLLTARARRVLEWGRDLLDRLRAIADAFTPAIDEVVPLFDRDDPLARLYHETAAMTDTALRLVPLLPATATQQLHLCEGLEAILTEVKHRLRTLTEGVARCRKEEDRIARLAGLLHGLASEKAVEFQAFVTLAEEVLAEAADGTPLRFVAGDAADTARFAASHSLTVARVIVRVARHDAEFRGRLLEPVLAALVHDVGMLHVPGDLLAHAGPLNDEQRRSIEHHCHVGAALAGRLLPDAAWLTAAVRSHHERIDGTGYPDGLHGHHLSPLTKLLAVCDVYSALCVTRPHRPAGETRSALTDTLLLVEQGQLDRHPAESLLHLSFYPVGTAVELADGSMGVVVATAAPGCDLRNPARPVVAVLVDAAGDPLPAPRHLDLLECEGNSVVRSLGVAERREVFGCFPEWVT